MSTFVEDCLAGRVRPEEIADYIDRWHGGAGGGATLVAFLGFTAEEYAAWVGGRRTPGEVVARRRARSGPWCVDTSANAPHTPFVEDDA